eukprot:jgi/Botrbrau1/9859/Bobra.0313s0028.1
MWDRCGIGNSGPRIVHFGHTIPHRSQIQSHIDPTSIPNFQSSIPRRSHIYPTLWDRFGIDVGLLAAGGINVGSMWDNFVLPVLYRGPGRGRNQAGRPICVAVGLIICDWVPLQANFQTSHLRPC